MRFVWFGAALALVPPWLGLVAGALILTGVVAEVSPIATSAGATLLAAAITGWFTYWVVARRQRGNVDTSEASELWDASTELRQELRNDVVDLRQRLQAANQREQAASQREHELRGRLWELESHERQLLARIHDQELKLNVQERRIAQLERDCGGGQGGTTT